MAHAKFTGKSAGTVATFGVTTLPGWREITITERGKPLATPIDTTVMGDSAYAFTDDPLGGAGSVSCSVQFTGFLSVTSHQDTDWLSLTIGSTGTLTVTTKASGDEWTQALMTFKTFNTGHEVAGVVPYTATFTHSTAVGAWSTDVP